MGNSLSSGVGLKTWQWRYCLGLAKAFGWKPEGLNELDAVIQNADRIHFIPVRDAFALSMALSLALQAFRNKSAGLTVEQADALKELTDVSWVEEIARFFCRALQLSASASTDRA